jgi:pyridoxamine 5'-phosphate oxidase
MDIGALRREYRRDGLRRESLAADPFEQFEEWFQEALEAGIQDSHGMSLATASTDGQPTLRTVLLKSFDQRGFVFFTNYGSLKARQIDENPQVALLFPWLGLDRQIEINGHAERISAAESIKYFITRPIGSRLGAWSSPQSRVITSRQVVEMQFEEMKRKFADGDVPLPSFWGGYRVTPHAVEFWQGRENRLHDRFLYSREAGDDGWTINRLAP